MLHISTNAAVFYMCCLVYRSVLVFFCGCCSQLSFSYSYLGLLQYLLKAILMLNVKHPPGRANWNPEQPAFLNKISATTAQNALTDRTRHRLRAPLSANSHAIPKLILNVKTRIVLKAHKNATEGMTAGIIRMNLLTSSVIMHHQSPATCHPILDVTTAIASRRD